MIELSYRKLVVKSVVPEGETAKSFYLAPADGGPLDHYFPGQHLPLRLTIPHLERPVFRCYTISNYGESFYRLTIKKELAPADKPEAASGLSSSYFHDTVRPGDILEAKPPSGNFWLDMSRNHPVVMLAGGIGVTPMMSMLEALDRAGSNRIVYFFFALRHGGDHVFHSQLGAIAERRTNPPHARVLRTTSGPRRRQARLSAHRPDRGRDLARTSAFAGHGVLRLRTARHDERPH